MENNPTKLNSRDTGAKDSSRPVSVPLPGSDAYDDLPQFPKRKRAANPC